MKEIIEYEIDVNEDIRRYESHKGKYKPAYYSISFVDRLSFLFIDGDRKIILKYLSRPKQFIYDNLIFNDYQTKIDSWKNRMQLIIDISCRLANEDSCGKTNYFKEFQLFIVQNFEMFYFI